MGKGGGISIESSEPEFNGNRWFGPKHFIEFSYDYPGNLGGIHFYRINKYFFRKMIETKTLQISLQNEPENILVI